MASEALCKLLGSALRMTDAKYRAAFTAVVCYGACSVNAAAFCPAHPRFSEKNLVRDLYAVYSCKKPRALPAELAESAMHHALVIAELLGQVEPAICNYLDVGSGAGLLPAALKEAIGARYLAMTDSADHRIDKSSVFVAATVQDLSVDWCRANGLPVKWDLISAFSVDKLPCDIFDLAKDLIAPGGYLVIRSRDVQSAADMIKAKGLYIAQVINELPAKYTMEQMSAAIMQRVSALRMTSQTVMVQEAKKYGWELVATPVRWNELTREYIACFKLQS